MAVAEPLEFETFNVEVAESFKKTGGTIVAEARIVSKTCNTMVVQIDIANEGRLCCCAQGTVLVRDPRKT